MDPTLQSHSASATADACANFASLLGSAEAVLFDFDGVIADSEVISLTTLRDALGQFGLDFTLEETRKTFLGTSLKTITAHVDQHGSGHATGFPTIWEEALFARFAKDLKPVPHVFDVIEWLDRHRIPFCIATSSTFRRLSAALAAMRVKNRFEHVFSAEQVARGKPAPDLFELAASKLNVRPQTCLVIEDSPHGIRAARAAGMQTVGFTGGQHLRDLQAEHSALLQDAGAGLILPSFEGFTKLVRVG